MSTCRPLISHQGGVSVGLAVLPCGGGRGEVDVLSGVCGGGGGRGIHRLLAVVGGSGGEGRHGGGRCGSDTQNREIDSNFELSYPRMCLFPGCFSKLLLFVCAWTLDFFPWWLWKVAFYSARSLSKTPEFCGPATLQDETVDTWSYFTKVFY